MEIQFIEKIGEGGFARVYKGTDELDRVLAVKIISPSMAAFSNAIEHAKALARSDHPNIVKVIAIEKVNDPETGAEVEGIVMEFVDGQTLESMLQKDRLTISQVKDFGTQIIAGLQHIHSKGLIHGDLHTGNIMVSNGNIKLLDILYRGTMAALSARSREEILHRDIIYLRVLLAELIQSSEFNPAEATAFQNALVGVSDLPGISTAFITTLFAASKDSDQRNITFSIARFEDPQFVAGEEYANALLSQLQVFTYMPIIEDAISRCTVREVHFAFLRTLWNILPEGDKQSVAQSLARTLDRELPNGRWWPHFRMLWAFGGNCWALMPAATKIRLENVVINDILSGKWDIHGFPNLKGGAIGSWAAVLWPLFHNQGVMLSNLISMLQMNWYTQNYVAEYFFQVLPSLAGEDYQKEIVISAIIAAIENNAIKVKSKLAQLPDDWQADIKARSTKNIGQ
jgi:hypothetical protein